MVLFPNAKINLGLNITGRRKDGYHNIASVFYPVPFCDVLEFIENKTSKEDEFYFTGLPIAGDISNNLVAKAIALLRAKFDIPPLKVYLHKIIPMGAGLGGGSSDGTCALKALNTMFELNLSSEILMSYALELGSDCPFFVKNEPTAVSGRGEIFQKVDIDLKDLWIVLGFPGKHIGTKEAYQNVLISSESVVPSDAIRNKPIENWSEILSNSFEPYAIRLHPEIGELKEYFKSKGAVYASMTGSGSTVYGLFKEEPDLSDMDFPFWKRKL